MMALGKRLVLLMFIHGIAAFINRDVKLPPFTHNKITRGYYGHLLSLASLGAIVCTRRRRENSKDYNIANLKWSIKIRREIHEHIHSTTHAHHSKEQRTSTIRPSSAHTTIDRCNLSFLTILSSMAPQWSCRLRFFCHCSPWRWWGGFSAPAFFLSDNRTYEWL